MALSLDLVRHVQANTYPTYRNSTALELSPVPNAARKDRARDHSLLKPAMDQQGFRPVARKQI